MKQEPDGRRATAAELVAVVSRHHRCIALAAGCLVLLCLRWPSGEIQRRDVLVSTRAQREERAAANDLNGFWRSLESKAARTAKKVAQLQAARLAAHVGTAYQSQRAARIFRSPARGAQGVERRPRSHRRGAMGAKTASGAHSRGVDIAGRGKGGRGGGGRGKMGLSGRQEERAEDSWFDHLPRSGQQGAERMRQLEAERAQRRRRLARERDAGREDLGSAERADSAFWAKQASRDRRLAALHSPPALARREHLLFQAEEGQLEASAAPPPPSAIISRTSHVKHEHQMSAAPRPPSAAAPAITPATRHARKTEPPAIAGAALGRLRGQRPAEAAEAAEAERQHPSLTTKTTDVRQSSPKQKKQKQDERQHPSLTIETADARHAAWLKQSSRQQQKHDDRRTGAHAMQSRSQQAARGLESRTPMESRTSTIASGGRPHSQESASGHQRSAMGSHKRKPSTASSGSEARRARATWRLPLAASAAHAAARAPVRPLHVRLPVPARGPRRLRREPASRRQALHPSMPGSRGSGSSTHVSGSGPALLLASASNCGRGGVDGGAESKKVGGSEVGTRVADGDACDGPGQAEAREAGMMRNSGMMDQSIGQEDAVSMSNMRIMDRTMGKLRAAASAEVRGTLETPLFLWHETPLFLHGCGGFVVRLRHCRMFLIDPACDVPD